MQMKVFQDFCESTSLHGYTYLYIATSVFIKVFWVIVIVAMTALGIVFIVSNTNDYLEANIITTIESSTAPLEVSFMYTSMTSLLMHTVAHSTRHSFRPKANNQSLKKFLSLAVS